MKRLAVMVAASIFMTGCMNNGIEWSELSFTRHRPADQDMVGTWVPVEKSLKKIVKSHEYAPPSPRIDLRADGTFSGTNVPDWFWGKQDPQMKFESGEGTWSVGTEHDVRTVYVLELKFPNNTRSINLGGQKPPYQLHITIGDPDSGNYLLFQQTPTAPKP